MKTTVVVGYDRTPSSERALTEAGREAVWRDAAVSIVHTFQWVAATPPMIAVPMGVEQGLREAAETVARAGARRLRDRYPGMSVESQAVLGPAADTLAEAARHAGLLLLGNRGRGGFAGLLLGSVSLRTLGYASCPTIIVRGPERAPADEIVLALDIEDPADEVLDFAFAEASRRDARLRVVNVWDLGWSVALAPDADDDLEAAKARAVTELYTGLQKVLSPWQAGHPEVRLDIEVAGGTPSAALVAASNHADLVVVGAHRRTDGHQGMRLGPITQALLHHAECPIAVVPRGAAD
ncbi:MAG: universal stress protein [Catenulispora sp.]|nr:universal stress protein [Catenulispora sp.]